MELVFDHHASVGGGGAVREEGLPGGEGAGGQSDGQSVSRLEDVSHLEDALQMAVRISRRVVGVCLCGCCAGGGDLGGRRRIWVRWWLWAELMSGVV